MCRWDVTKEREAKVNTRVYAYTNANQTFILLCKYLLLYVFCTYDLVIKISLP